MPKQKVPSTFEQERQSFALELSPGHQMAQLFEYLDDILFFVKNRQGHFMFCNNSFAKAMGCKTPEELYGKCDHDFFNKDIADGFVKDDLYVMEKGGVIANRTEILPNALQSFDWVVSNKIPLKNKDGVIIGIAGLTTRLSSGQGALNCPMEIYKVLDYINENFHRKISLQELADLFHLSVRSLERYFKVHFQTTFRKYLHQVRMNAVCHALIYSELEISKIAQMNGYFDQSHLTASFSKSLGLTPRQYRLKYGNIRAKRLN